jgi:(S)-2-hydroxyglutarate dehydrogenase
MSRNQVVIIGGGIVGLATAYQWLRRHPGGPLTVVEKEPDIARHQTGHNSGVLHSGIYYKPGSLKAVNCRLGKQAMQQFCQSEGIPFEICGKVVVAVDDRDLPALHRIHERAQANGVRCELISKPRLLELEPHVAGIQALHVPEAGIVDYKQVCRRLAEKVIARVERITRGAREVVVHSTAGDIVADYLVNCAGLHSDRVARMTGADPRAQIVPFRGEYYELKPSAWHLCRNLIYPTPDPQFPFLGVHFTRMISGAVECGPNAVLAFAREGYRLRDVNLRDLYEALSYRGFQKMAGKHWRMGLGELWRSFSKQAFVRALQRLVPSIHAEDLEPAPAGIRAQAVAPDGSLVDDFLFVEGDRVVNVCNAPSPSATSSLQIGATIADRLSSLIGEHCSPGGAPRAVA